MAELSFPHWFQEGGSHTNDGAILWNPLWKYDSNKLEIESVSGQNTVFVQNRRARVNIREREITSCYDRNIPSKKVIRGTWFYFYTPTKSFFPFSEIVANNIEIWFQGLKLLTSTNGDPVRAEVEMSFSLPHCRGNEILKYKFVALKEVAPDPKISDSHIDGFSVTMRSMAFNDLFSAPIQIERGFRYVLDPEESWCETEVGHLFFVVHGIGQTMFAKSESSFQNNILSIRKLAMEQQEVIFQQGVEQGVGTSESNYRNKKRIEFIPIEWYDVIRSDDTSLAGDLASVTLPNLQVVRQIANEVVLDILLYLTPEFREKILECVCSKIIELYTVFLELNPTYEGRCSVIGHSLGTVILFDLLSNQQREPEIGTRFSLPFRPHAFLALGSPLGLFLSIRKNASSIKQTSSTVPGSLDIKDIPISRSFYFPTCSAFYNLFHPHDPVAYRIEPLLDPALHSKGPVLVVHHKGGFRPHYMIKNIATQITETVNIVMNPSNWLTKFQSNVQNTQVIPSLSNSSDTESTAIRKFDECPHEIPHVVLNDGRRVDFMLQETGLENANEYISSITSHTGYFDMKDVARFIVVNVANGLLSE